MDTRRDMNLLLKQNRVFSAQASWEKLLEHGVVIRNINAFRELFGLGIVHEWVDLDQLDGCYLLYSCVVGCLDTVKQILTIVNSSQPLQRGGRCFFEALTTALRNENFECFEHLVKHAEAH